MIKRIEPHHAIYSSVDELLDPETLGRLLSKPVTRVEDHPMNGHSGLAGGQLSYVETDAGRLVLKRMSIASDWIMFASDDKYCRSIRLWQYGFLDQLSPNLEHRIIACARDGEGWAILMDDLTGHVYAWDRPMEAKLVTVFLDVLSIIHATYWNDPRLKEPHLGLCNPAQLLDQSSLPMAQKYKHLSMGLIPEWVRVGWKVMEALLEPDVFEQLHNLSENPQPLFDSLTQYSFTLLHGDYRAENLAYLKQPVAIDWQEATCSLMTIDLAWFVRQDFVRETMGQVHAVNYYRQRLEANLGQPFDDTIWQAMVDLGFLVDTLRATCFTAYWYKQTSDNPENQTSLEMALKIRNKQVRDAMRWL
jgi:hypothetical protein